MKLTVNISKWLNAVQKIQGIFSCRLFQLMPGGQRRVQKLFCRLRGLLDSRGVKRAISASADMRLNVVRPRRSGELLIKDILGDPPCHMERRLQYPALRRVNEADGKTFLRDLLGHRFAATMNISWVTRVASVANTAMPMAGKI